LWLKIQVETFLNEKGKVAAELHDVSGFRIWFCYVISPTTKMAYIPNFMVNRNSFLLHLGLAKLFKEGWNSLETSGKC
jgi:hypothetical protein